MSFITLCIRNQRGVSRYVRCQLLENWFLNPKPYQFWYKVNFLKWQSHILHLAHNARSEAVIKQIWHGNRINFARQSAWIKRYSSSIYFIQSFLMIILSCLFSLLVDLDQPWRSFGALMKSWNLAMHRKLNKWSCSKKSRKRKWKWWNKSGGHEAVHVMVEEGHQICVASSSCKSGFLYAFSLFDLCRKQEDQQNYATHVS